MPPVSTDGPTEESRVRAIAAIEGVLERAVRRRRVARWLGGVAAAAALAAVAFGAYRYEARTFLATAEPSFSATTDGALLAPSDRGPPSRASPVVGYPLGEGASVWLGSTDGPAALGAPLVEGRRLEPGSRVETRVNGRAALAFATGTSAMLGESAELTIDGDEGMQILRLGSGSLDLRVAKVSADRRFVVATPDAEVEVRGTKFRVSIGAPDPSCSDEAVTHLVVTEGVVVVRHGGVEKRVAAGEQWPGDCVAPTAIAAPFPSSHAPSSGGPSVVSTLAEQNDLFAEAIVAKRRGESQAALASFDRFLSTYPSSPLAQSAAVERMRLLRTMKSARAPGAARQYLTRYSNGFARTEAEAILAGAP
jgi:hypothetical protein